tara:strand:+ start:713 stop:1000 length:288 start_codon:yes stop_codon:yes gene_type:complete
MSLTNLDKKCTIDYLTDLIPTQRRMMSSVLNGKTLDIKSQIGVIRKILELEPDIFIYDYKTILKVFGHWIDIGKGDMRLDVLHQELKSDFNIRVV